MKTTKRILAIVLSVVMVMALMTSAFAAETGSITVSNPTVGQTYTIYQILSLESYNADTGAYTYKATDAWAPFINSAAIKGVYVNVDAQGYVTWVDGADAAAFAKLAQAYAKNNSTTVSAQGTKTTTADDNTVAFTGLALGYYLVDSTLGTLCSLDTTNPTVEMEEKNGTPSNVKTVEEDSTGAYGSVNDADIGQTVTFKSTITAQAGAENYVFHDKMSAGLTYVGITSITLNGTEVAAANYTVNTTPTDGDTFDVAFTQTFCDTLKDNDQIVITYTATVNSGAVVAGEGNPNESKVSYGDASNSEFNVTPPSITKTYTWKFDVLKYGNGDETKKLAGAKFVLMNKDQSKVAQIENGKLKAWVDVTDNMDLTPYELTTDDNGSFAVEGLDADTYYLVETQAPAGYNKLTAPVEVKITATASNDGLTMTQESLTVKINNQSGSELPSTGGIGTTIFYVLGGMMVVCAGVLLITKKRMVAAN